MIFIDVFVVYHGLLIYHFKWFKNRKLHGSLYDEVVIPEGTVLDLAGNSLAALDTSTTWCFGGLIFSTMKPRTRIHVGML